MARFTHLFMAAVMAVALGACADMLKAEKTSDQAEAAPGVTPRTMPQTTVDIRRKQAEARAAQREAQLPPPPERTAEPARVTAKPKGPQIDRGTGIFLNPDAGKGRAMAKPTGSITLNFADTDIREIVRTVLGNLLKANYVIHPKVSGKVTVQTSRPLPRSALLTTLDSILQLVGAAMIDTGTVYRIVPAAEAPRQAPPLRPRLAVASRQAGFMVQIVPLQFISAAEMEKILEPLAPKGSILRTDETRNLLILAGSRRDLNSLIEAVDIFDVDWLAGMSVGMFPIKYAKAKEITGELTKIFGGDGKGGPLAKMLRFIPVERLNAVLVISPQPGYIKRAENWIERLDRSTDETGRRLFVYYVENGRATDLASILGQIFGTEAPQQPAQARLAPGLRPTRMRSTRTSAVTGTGIPATPRTAALSPPATGTRTPQRPSTTAARAPSRAAQAVSSEQSIKLGEGREIRIIANDATNALIILATAADYRMIEAALKKLDIVPLQVLIEATIAEVTLTDKLKYGLQWFFTSGDIEVGLFEGSTNALTQAFPGFSFLFNTTDIKSVINALQTVTDVNVISSPQLMVLDNQTATLQIGDQVPFSTQSAVNLDNVIETDTSTTTTITSSNQLIDTGIILRVTPRVNKGGLVIMEIEQEVSDAINVSSSGISLPTIQQRKITSTVAIQSGETVALGGLIKDKKDRTKSGLPWLSQIPVLGALFGKTDNTDTRTELLILITPRVIRNLHEARAVTDELRKRLRAVIPLGKVIQ